MKNKEKIRLSRLEKAPSTQTLSVQEKLANAKAEREKRELIGRKILNKKR